MAVVIIFLSNIEIGDFAAFLLRLAVIWIGSGIGSGRYIFSDIKIDYFTAVLFSKINISTTANITANLVGKAVI